MQRLPRSLPLFLLAAACGPVDEFAADGLSLGAPSEQQQAVHTVCADGPTTFGIDVSKWQGQINWAGVASAGAKFAIIRTNHGLGDIDERFQENWAGAKANGVIRGAYQYFLSNEDATAQANLMLELMGPLSPGDLPPMLDVESQDGVGAAERINKIRIWLDIVEGATGVKPIIYTGGYFWTDFVGTGEFNDHPLMHPQYTTAACPSAVPDFWDRWTIWQYSDEGTLGGIVGPVDMDRFNGSYDDLVAFTIGDPVCGDGTCTAGEAGACAADCPVCEALPSSGGVISESGPCFTAQGSPASWRRVTDAGDGGGLTWTFTTDVAAEDNNGDWRVLVSEAGRYRVEGFMAAAYADSTTADYRVRHDGVEDVFSVNQTAADGWNVIAADVRFSGTGDELVHLGDNTGEALGTQTRVVFDAIRLVRLDAAAEGEGEGEGEPASEGEGEPGEGEGEQPAEGEGEAAEGDHQFATITPAEGCSATAAPPATLALFALLLLPRRRR